MNQGVSRRART